MDNLAHQLPSPLLSLVPYAGARAIFTLQICLGWFPLQTFRGSLPRWNELLIIYRAPFPRSPFFGFRSRQLCSGWLVGFSAQAQDSAVSRTSFLLLPAHLREPSPAVHTWASLIRTHTPYCVKCLVSFNKNFLDLVIETSNNQMTLTCTWHLHFLSSAPFPRENWISQKLRDLPKSTKL